MRNATTRNVAKAADVATSYQDAIKEIDAKKEAAAKPSAGSHDSESNVSIVNHQDLSVLSAEDLVAKLYEGIDAHQFLTENLAALISDGLATGLDLNSAAREAATEVVTGLRRAIEHHGEDLDLTLDLPEDDVAALVFFLNVSAVKVVDLAEAVIVRGKAGVLDVSDQEQRDVARAIYVHVLPIKSVHDDKVKRGHIVLA